jgi:hypothetical protein
MGLLLTTVQFGCTSGGPEANSRQEALSTELSPDGEVTLKTAADYEKRRDALIQYIWGSMGAFPGSQLPDQVKRNVPSPIGSLRNLGRVDALVVNMDAGEHTYLHHFIANVPNNRLVIVHQGHGPPCGFGDSKGGDGDWGLVNTIDTLLANGFSVLGKYMPHLLPDGCDADDPHAKMFAMIKLPRGSVVKFFVEPLTIALNYLRTKSKSDGFPAYLSYDMVGLSGGGWSTTLYAALDPTIQISIPVAGTSPLYMRKYSCFNGEGSEAGCYNGYYGDTEQDFPPLYRVTGYLDLYALGSHGRVGVGAGSTRKQIQILNRNDTCCFGEREFKGPGTGAGAWESAVRGYETLVAAAVGATGTGSFKLVIDENAIKHEISRWALANVIMPELLRAQPSSDAAAPATWRAEVPATTTSADADSDPAARGLAEGSRGR